MRPPLQARSHGYKPERGFLSSRGVTIDRVEDTDPHLTPEMIDRAGRTAALCDATAAASLVLSCIDELRDSERQRSATFTQVRGREVHYARAGEGLRGHAYAAPCSSKGWPRSRRFSARFTKSQSIAGFGYQVRLRGYDYQAGSRRRDPGNRRCARIEQDRSMAGNRRGVAVEFARRFRTGADG